MSKMGEKKSKFEVCDFGAWSMNIVSSVGIIMANKELMSPEGFAFAFATTLTGFHFTIISIVGLLSNLAGYSSPKPIPLSELIWFWIVANASIAGMNFSLMLNSVGFYQISKLSMIPMVCIMEWILDGKHFSKEVKMSVALVVFGVGVCTVTHVHVNAKGFLCACVAVFSTSLQQITIGSLQKKYSIGSFELLSKTAPIQALSLLVLGPFVDYHLTGKFISSYKISPGAIFFTLLSSSLAVFSNISQYLCIGRFSAVTFQVLGHMKTVCVVTLGWLLFDLEMTLKNITGVVITVVGMMIYNCAVEAEKQRESSSKIIGSMKDERVKLLNEGMEETSLEDVEFGFVSKG